MTAITGSRRSLLGMVVQLLHSRSRARTGQPSRLGLAIKDHAMTFAALVAADIGGFRVLHGAGWFILALTIVLADWKIQS